ncbi:MAG: cytochrome-c oxidase, partial [Salinigranum sp.]
QLATLGALVLAVGQIIFVWNVVISWLEGPTIETGDPWNLEEYGMRTNEWEWFGRRLETAIADGGDEDAVADGGDRDAVADGGDEDAVGT